MIWEKAKEGSITVFASLTLMLVAALILTLLEAARLQEVQKTAQMRTDAAVESLFANYNATLWENYHMLLLDDGGSDTDFTLATRENMLMDLLKGGGGSEGSNENSLLLADPSMLSISDYTLIGDGAGQAFCLAASAYMENNAAYETYSFASDLYDGITDAESSDSEAESLISGGEDLFMEEPTEGEIEEELAVGLHYLAASESDSAESDSAEISYTTFGVFNPIKFINAIREYGVLPLVLPDQTGISTVSFDSSGAMSGRDTATGTSALATGAEEADGLTDDLLTEAYLERYFSYYGNDKEDHYLSYELEYILCGKDSDEANLRAIVTRLLWIREVINFAYIVTDTTKDAEAAAVAGTLSAFLLSPELYEPLHYGILAAWAYAESILDVRGLLQGKKVPLYKDSASWTTELSNISDILSGDLCAKESETGFTYSQYLFVFLVLESQETECNRALDAMELTVRDLEESDSFCIDHMLLEAKLSVSYVYHTAFMGMEALTAGRAGSLTIDAVSDYSYRRAGV